MTITDILTNIRLFNSANGISLIPTTETVEFYLTEHSVREWEELLDSTTNPIGFLQEAVKHASGGSFVVGLDSHTFNKFTIHPYVCDAYKHYVLTAGTSHASSWCKKLPAKITSRGVSYCGLTIIELNELSPRFDIFHYKVNPPETLADQLNLEIQSLMYWKKGLTR